MGLLIVGLVLHRVIPVRAAAPTAANAKRFTLMGLDGKPIAPSAYEGKAVVLNFWAPWCPPCKLEIPWLQKLQDANRGRLVVVGVVADPDTYARAAAMMRQKGITYLLAQDTPSLEMEFGDPSALPTSYYISPSLHVVHSVTGVAPEYVMRRYAADAMGQ
ncbi:MAG TPA: TlpA disulfide reductase family protein [Acidobacteriaceae bacterium]|nr:TlpA disulfide reductase family protein [Acidobacteriaceae bacterium]